MKLSKHFKVTLSLLGFTALAMSIALSAADINLAKVSIVKNAQDEVQCDFKKDIFKQWAYIFSDRTSCVYR